MAGRIRAGLTPAEGRKFAFPVGVAFLVLGAVALWRGHPLLVRSFGGVGLALLLAGAIIPGKLGPVYHAWMGLAHAISKVTTPVFMAVVYYVVILPVGILRRAARNPIRHRPVEGSYWQLREEGARRGNLERQF